MFYKIMFIIIIAFVIVTMYMGYKLYDSNKVPKDTPDIVKDVKNSVKKATTKSKSKK